MFVFLSWLVPSGFFPLRKANTDLFLIVKRIFFKIKLWPMALKNPKKS